MVARSDGRGANLHDSAYHNWICHLASGDTPGALLIARHKPPMIDAIMTSASTNQTEEEGYRSSMGALFGSLDSKELGSVLLFLSSRELLAWREVSKVCTFELTCRMITRYDGKIS